MQLSAIDLNLLVVLDALLASRSLGDAAKRVGLSQSATSHALARLRDTLSDPLFVREGRRLVPTARALALRAPLRRALSTLETSLGGADPFDARTATRTFRIATADYGALVVLPSLYPRVAAEAPAVDLFVVSDGGDTGALASGEVDLAIVPQRSGIVPPGGVRQRVLFEERFVCVVRRRHPILTKKKIDLASWLALPHALVAPGGTRNGIVDEALRARGLSRRIALAVPHFLVAPHVVATSDLVLTLAERVARTYASHKGLRTFRPPLPLDRFRIAVARHERLDGDPGLDWLERTIVDVARDL